VAVLSLVSVPVAAEFVLGEALFIAHIVLLVEGLGFIWGLAAFTAIWAALGVAVLAGRDLLWPRMAPWIDSQRERLARLSGRVLAFNGIGALLAALGISAAAVAVVLPVALAGGDIADWLLDHQADIGTFLAAVAVIFVILLLIARLGRGLERWVRSIADTAGPATRWLANILAMAMLGPALSWLVFRLLGYSGRSTYVLTLVSAPVFGVVWVPFYAFGVWGLIGGSF
jgi:hypothetical protein